MTYSYRLRAHTRTHARTHANIVVGGWGLQVEMRAKHAELAADRSAMSTRLGASEMERLRLAKAVIDAQLEATAAQEQAERRIFAQAGAVLELQNTLVERTLQRDHLDARAAASDKGRLKVGHLRQLLRQM